VLWIAPLLTAVNILLAVSTGIDDGSKLPWVSGLGLLLGITGFTAVLYFRQKPCALGRFITLLDFGLISIVSLVILATWLVILNKTPARIEHNLNIIIVCYAILGALSVVYGIWYGKNRWESRSMFLRSEITENSIPAYRAQFYFSPPGGQVYNRSRMAYYSSTAALGGIIASHSSSGVYVMLIVAFILISLLPANIASMVMRRIYLLKNKIPLDTRIAPASNSLFPGTIN